MHWFKSNVNVTRSFKPAFLWAWALKQLVWHLVDFFKIKTAPRIRFLGKIQIFKIPRIINRNSRNVVWKWKKSSLVKWRNPKQNFNAERRPSTLYLRLLRHDSADGRQRGLLHPGGPTLGLQLRVQPGAAELGLGHRHANLASASEHVRWRSFRRSESFAVLLLRNHWFHCWRKVRIINTWFIPFSVNYL